MRMTKVWFSAMFGSVVLLGVPAQALTALSVMSDATAPMAAEPQVKDDLFAGTEKFAQGASDVSEVNLDKNMLGMVKSKGKNGDLAGKMDFIVVHSYTYDKPGMYRMEDVDVFRKRLADGSWNCFVHTRDKDGSTDVCARSGHDESNELVVLTAEAKELTFVHMKGRMSLDDLSKMNGNVGGGGRKPVPPAPPARPSSPPPPASAAPPAPGM